MSALVTDPSTHATWSPSLNGPALAREMSTPQTARSQLDVMRAFERLQEYGRDPHLPGPVRDTARP